MPAAGLEPPPKNIPVAPSAPIIIPPMFVGISIPCLHFSASSIKSNEPVPIFPSFPNMIHSETPLRGSNSPWAAASIRISTCNKENVLNHNVKLGIQVVGHLDSLKYLDIHSWP
jgi:hypothetical protein